MVINRSTFFGVLSVALIIGAVVGWASHNRSVTLPGPNPGDLTASVIAEQQPETIRVTGIWAKGNQSDAVSLGGTGTITQIDAGPVTPSPFEVMAERDGAPVYALYSEQPFWRTITAGAAGPDVDFVLDQIGQEDRTGSKITAPNVREFWRTALGEETSTNLPPAIRPDQFVWLGPVEPGSEYLPAVTIGTVWPEQAAPLFTRTDATITFDAGAGFNPATARPVSNRTGVTPSPVVAMGTSWMVAIAQTELPDSAVELDEQSVAVELELESDEMQTVLQVPTLSIVEDGDRLCLIDQNRKPVLVESAGFSGLLATVAPIDLDVVVGDEIMITSLPYTGSGVPTCS